MKKSS
jgi:hypothetical protein